MRRDGHRLSRRLVIGVLATALLGVAACGDDDDSGTAATTAAGAAVSTTGTTGAATSGAQTSSATTIQQKAGGQLVYGLLFLPSTVDPISNPGYGGTGGEEMHALYGHLVNVDSKTGDQIPGGMAQSLSSNADLTVWTLKLRSGITFTTGEPYDAAAVVKNIKRFTDPALHASVQTAAAQIASVDAPDASTVVFTLSKPNAGWAAQLAGPLGTIAAPSFLDKYDGGDKNATPIGAGPFKFESFKPNEALVVSRNDQYWAGKPFLDSISFQTVPSASGTFQAFQNGQLAVANIYDPTIFQQIQKDKIRNFYVPIFGTSGTVFNARQGKLFSDLRLRQAVAMAIDPKVFNDRVWDGNLPIVGNQFVAKESQWSSPGDTGIALDTAKAKSLVDAVKKDNPSWDGSVDFVCYTGGGGAPENHGLALKSMLDPIGFNINITKNLDTNQFVQRVPVNHQFDMACWGGWSFLDYDPAGVLFSSFASASPSNVSGAGSPAMDAALEQIRVAATADQKKAALQAFNAEFNTLLPGVIQGALPLVNVYSDKVQGLSFSGRSIPLLEKVSLSS
jgi:peptide/nickel transport system substrate-binding protein